MKYKMNPVEFEAVQWTGENLEEIKAFAGDKCFTRTVDRVDKLFLVVIAFEGHEDVNIGDYIIKDAYGYFYPCKSAFFERTYELVKPLMKCLICGEVIEKDEEALWGHIQMNHEEVFKDIQDLESPDMIEEYYEDTNN